MDLTTGDNQIVQSNLPRERAKLIGFTACVALAGGALAVIAGPPRAPAGLPQTRDVVALLTGSTLPFEPLLLVVVDLAWLLWVWLVGSLCLELVLAAAEALAAGATWVPSVRRLSDRWAAPLVRRTVTAAFAVQILTRGVPIAAAQPLPPAETSTLVSDSQSSTAESVDSPTYLVRAGDTLWSIAERAYGSGTEYRRLVDANLGRRMSDGRVFTAQGVIQPGWELLVPDASWGVQQDDGHRWYVVRAGDTLSRIAGSLLGDGSRWHELFELNRGATSPDGRHVLTDANVIWPGLRLQLPDSPTNADTDPDAPPAADDTAPGIVDPASDLIVATAAAATTAAAPDQAALPEADAPPLLRTPHALDPVVPEPADSTLNDSESSQILSPPASVAGDADVSLPNTPLRPDIPAVPLAAAGGLGLALAAGLAFGARRVRRLRPLPKEPESEVVVQRGFAEAQLAHDLTRALHGMGFDPVETLVARLDRFLGEYNLANVGVVSVKHGRSSTSIALRCGLAEQPILVDLAPVFAETLEAETRAWVSTDQDVVLCLERLRRTRLLPSTDAAQTGPYMVPMGVLMNRQVFSAAWNSVGHVLIVSLPGHGAETILTSLVATLTSRRSPEQLGVWMLASKRALSAPLYDVPHLIRIVDPADEPALGVAVDDLRAEVDHRAAHPGGADLTVVVPELTQLGEHAAQFSLLAGRAAELGVRFLAASICIEDVLTNPLTAHFATRMVLRMQGEETSVALLGVADAAFLGGGGRLFLRLDGREPVELYGYQVAPEHLERLVKLMRSAYPGQPETPAAGVDTTGVDTAGVDTPVDPPPPAPTGDHGSPTDSMDQSGQWASETSPPEQFQPTNDESTPSGQVEDSAPSGQIQASAPRGEMQASLIRASRAPIEVQCLGGPRVLCAGQQVWPRSAAGDAKPWEFLLYLACQPPEGVSRDEAVEALWPEDEQPEDAGHRFRQLRYRLRRLLTAVPGAPSSDGVYFDRGILRLDPGVVYCDAREFLIAVRTARGASAPEDAREPLERARALYVGDLLEGPDAHRYAWLEERGAGGVTLREHFRRLFQQASDRLAELYANAGVLDVSLEIYHELTDMDPGDERVWQALFRLHARRGDRGALARELQRLREALRELADDVDGAEDSQLQEPSTELMQEYERLQASLRGREREAASV